MAKGKATALDKIVGYVSPGAGCRRLRQRQQFDMQAAGYSSANAGHSRRRMQKAWNRRRPGDEDSVIGSHDRTTVALECRDLFTNNSIVAGAVRRFPSYAIWLGLRPKAMTTDDGWNKAREERDQKAEQSISGHDGFHLR